jgi:hypothetical protein
LAERDTLTVWQHCCFNIHNITAEKVVRYERLVLVAITAVLSLLPEKTRYPKLGVYPKYDDFTLLLS